MILPVAYSHTVVYVVRRGHKHRHETMIDDGFVEIAEASAAEAPVAFIVRPCPSGIRYVRGRECPLRPVQAVTFRGRIYWPMLSRNGERMSLPAWRRWLAKARCTKQEPAPSTVAANDPLTASKPLRRDLRPLRRVSDLLDVRLVSDDRTEAQMTMAQCARNVLLRDGKLYIAGGEPVWALWPAQGAGWLRSPQPLHLDACASQDAAAQMEDRPHGGQLPFSDCEYFRVDRREDAHRRRSAIIAEDPRAFFEGEACAIEMTGAWTVAEDPLPRQLARLEQCIADHVNVHVSRFRKSSNWDLPVTQIARLPEVEEEIRVMADFPPTFSLDVHVQAARLRDLWWALEGVPVPREDLSIGYAERLRYAIGRACARYNEDLAAGVLSDPPSTPISPDDDDAIAEIAR